MRLNTDHLLRCIRTLESSLAMLNDAAPDSIDYEVFRNAVVKGFELVLEIAGTLLRKSLKAYGGSPKAVDELFYKDVLRHAGKHGLISPEEIERWFAYRDNRNNTAHDYGEGFALLTLALMPAFLNDARRVESMLREKFGDDQA
ncbi:MAG: nucleotidyltransferase [Rhodocyclales bacterium RIFCSPLOWO2_02_FULL_63_24]|nr:MAG: nucleotidyltransferase [Rhodocyclales bacterium GWA2_65_19]OHC71832.1 MAG: nucleotidyltransferase [Rhodocyclales bacterium RIFCSPLOWO2_02_FULL_63_24]